MADFEAPSFSLGFDFDLLDSEPQIPTATQGNTAWSASNQSSVDRTTVEDDDDDFETLTVVDSDSENHGAPPKLKRLRRGSTVSSASDKSKADLHSSVVVDDDDIEDFSSPEDNRTAADEQHLSTQHHSFYNSSKFRLSGHGVLTKQSGKKKQNVSNVPESVITSCNKPPFPKLTVSPLRRFQLIDSESDSDDPPIIEGATNTTCNKSESYLNPRQPDFVHSVGLNEQQKLKESINTSTRKDLWEDFLPEKSFHFPTPVLDEVCKEYFSSMKDKSKSQSNKVKSNHNSHVPNNIIDLGDPCPPAHQYFFHADPMVQELVRTRLPNFFPLNAAKGDSELPSMSNIDYMGQFNCGEKSKQAARSNNAETSTRNNSRKSKTRVISQGFMNPKFNTEKGIPKDAGKRRVQADGQSAGAGHWFTNQDGKRVYVSKKGQEMTGRAAYILYKKESGAGFKTKKSKKSSTKKK